MIELSANTAILLYLLTTLGVVMGIWGWSHLQSGKKQPLAPEQKLMVCEHCHYAFLSDALDELYRCPQCRLLGSVQKGRKH